MAPVWEGKDAKIAKIEQRQSTTFPNTWQIEMQNALCHDPICAILDLLSPTSSFRQREVDNRC